MPPSTDDHRMDSLERQYEQFADHILLRMEHLEHGKNVCAAINLRHEDRLRYLEVEHKVLLQDSMDLVGDLRRDLRRWRTVFGVVTVSLVTAFGVLLLFVELAP